MKIKLVFEIGVIGDFHHSQAGLYRVADELLKQFSTNKEVELHYSLFAHFRSKTTTKDVERILNAKEINIRSVNSRKRILFLPFRKEKLFKFLYKKLGISDYVINENSILNKAQIYHTPYYPIPKELNKYKNLKKVITVHDLIPIIFPNYNSDKILMDEIFESISSDDYVICVSENTKKDLLEIVPKINPNNVFVSLLAASPKIFHVCEDKEKFRDLQQKYHLPNKYFLGLSTLEPRKNIDHVINCFVRTITENNIDDLSLVLVGSKGWDYEKIFEAHENSEKLKAKILILGRVPDEDLATIYSNASAFFYMSFYEGFGLPPLEAMQCGVPVVVSNNSSLPEVVGDAGILLNPTDKNMLCQTMFELYKNKELRAKLSKKSLAKSKEFSWQKTMNQHLAIYKKILNTEI